MYNRINFGVCGIKFLSNWAARRHFSIYNGDLHAKLKSGSLTYYDVLQVPRNADKAQIKKAYLKLVKEYHPDRSKSPDTRSVFICIKESHDVLVDRNKRILYDQKLRFVPAQRRQIYRRHPAFNTAALRRASDDGTRLARSDPFHEERYERYRRYTAGEREESEYDPHAWIKTVGGHKAQIGALAVACVTVSVVCLVSGEVLAQFPRARYTEADVRGERTVRAYFNPVTEEWERIIAPFEAPLPETLISHYRARAEDFDASRVPRKRLTTLQVRPLTAQMPLSLTVRPTLLYDRSRRRPVLVEHGEA